MNGQSNNGSSPARRVGRPRRAVVDGKMKCPKCGKMVPVEDWAKDSSRNGGIGDACRDCCNKRHKGVQSAEYYRNYRAKKKESQSEQ